MNEVLKFSIDSINLLEEMSDEQLAIAEVWICHNQNNLHNFPIKLEAIQNAIPTLYNKFIVAGYENGDFMGHEGKNQLILGFFPQDNDVRFEEKDGKQYLVANAIISKIYAEWAYDILCDDNYREVSMEIIVVDTENIDGTDWISAFVFMGVTVLGLDWTAACPGSNVQITKFSTDKMVEQGEKAYHQYRDHFAKVTEWEIPSAVKINAIKGLDLKKQYEFGGNSVSLSFARFISKNDTISEAKAKNYLKYFPKTIKELSFSEPPDKEYINYMLFGGGEGQSWMHDIRLAVEQKNEIHDYFDTELIVNKSNILSTTDWSHIDKAHLKQSVIKAKNFEEIAPQVFMKLSEGWEQGIEGAFNFPVMERHGSELIYNKSALSNALEYAKQNNDDEIMVKITNIMQTLEMGKEEESKVTIQNVEFTELTYRNKVDIIDKYINDNHYDFYVSDISDDFVIIYDWEESFYYKVPYTIADGTVSLDMENKVAVINAWTTEFSSNQNTEGEQHMENITEPVNENFADTENQDKEDKEEEKEEDMACKEGMAADDADSDKEEDKEDDKTDKEEMSDDSDADDADEEDMSAKEEETEDKKATMSAEELEAKCYALEKENEELKASVESLNAFKASIEQEKKDNIVLQTIFDVQTKCPAMPQEDIDALKEASANFALDKMEDWKNMVYSKAFVFSNGVNDKKTTFTKIGLPFAKEEKSKKGLWD